MTGLNLIPCLAANGGEVWEGVALMVVGMTIVFIALSAVGIVIAASSAIAKRMDGGSPAADLTVEDEEMPVSAPAVEETASPEQSPDQLIAVLTAAAAVALGKSVRVVGITRSPQTSSAWSQMGRSTIHSSHNLRKNL